MTRALLALFTGWVGVLAAAALGLIVRQEMQTRAEFRRVDEVDAWVIAWTNDARREGWL